LPHAVTMSELAMKVEFLKNIMRLVAVGGRLAARGVVGRGRGRTASPHFLTGGTRPPLPPLFWTEIRAKVSPLLQLVTY